MIGFTGNDGSGSYGLESYYNSELSGVNGRKYGFINEDSEAERKTAKAQDGNSLVTTINLGLQELIESHIKSFNDKLADAAKGITRDYTDENESNHASGLGSKNTAVMVMDPNTGEILAEASYPEYNILL